MKKDKKELRDPYFMFIGNLLIFENGIGTISDIKYIVIREKKHIFSKPRYFAFPGEQEVIVGRKKVTAENNIPILINSERLHGGPYEKKIDAKEVSKIFIMNNDINKLKQLKF